MIGLGVGGLEVLVDDLVVGAISLDVCQPLVEGIFEGGIVALEDRETVGPASHLGRDGLEAIALGDAVGQYRVVVEDSRCITGLHLGVHGVGLVQGLDGESVLLRDGLGVGQALGAGLTDHGLALEALVSGNVGILLDGHLHARLEVRIREVEDLLALVGDRHSREHSVGLFRLNRLEGGVEANRLDVNLESLTGRNLMDEVHVDTDHLTGGVTVLKRCEGGVSGNDEGLALDRRGVVGMCLGHSGAHKGHQAHEGSHDDTHETSDPL